MAQICLDSLDVIPAFNGSNGITVPEIMKAGVFISVNGKQYQNTASLLKSDKTHDKII